MGFAVLLIQLEASDGPDGGGRGPRTRDSPAVRPPAVARSAMGSSTASRHGLHLNAGRTRPSRPAPSPSCMRAPPARAHLPRPGGRRDGARQLAPEPAPASRARSALWPPDPADFGRPEAITPAHLRHGRSGCAWASWRVAARRPCRITGRKIVRHPAAGSAPIVDAPPSARRASPSARAGRGDGRRAPERVAGEAGGARRVMQHGPADFGHPEVIARRNRATCVQAARRRPGAVGAATFLDQGTTGSAPRFRLSLLCCRSWRFCYRLDANAEEMRSSSSDSPVPCMHGWNPCRRCAALRRRLRPCSLADRCKAGRSRYPDWICSIPALQSTSPIGMSHQHETGPYPLPLVLPRRDAGTSATSRNCTTDLDRAIDVGVGASPSEDQGKTSDLRAHG